MTSFEGVRRRGEENIENCSRAPRRGGGGDKPGKQIKYWWENNKKDFAVRVFLVLFTVRARTHILVSILQKNVHTPLTQFSQFSNPAANRALLLDRTLALMPCYATCWLGR